MRLIPLAPDPRSQCWRRFRIGAHDGAARRGLSRPEGNALALEWPPPHGRGGPYRRKSMTACASSDQMILAPNGPQCTLCNSQRCCVWVFTAIHRGMPARQNQAAIYDGEGFCLLPVPPHSQSTLRRRTFINASGKSESGPDADMPKPDKIVPNYRSFWNRLLGNSLINGLL